MSEATTPLGICSRCGTIAGTDHTLPECDARYNARYNAARMSEWRPRIPVEVRDLLAVIGHLLDEEVMTPSVSAWEFHHVDAEAVYNRLKAAYEAVVPPGGVESYPIRNRPIVGPGLFTAEIHEDGTASVHPFSPEQPS